MTAFTPTAITNVFQSGSDFKAMDEKRTLTTREDQQTLADDMIVLLRQIVNDNDDPKVRKQIEEEIERWERHRMTVS
jgi:hypothetical protein